MEKALQHFQCPLSTGVGYYTMGHIRYTINRPGGICTPPAVCDQMHNLPLDTVGAIRLDCWPSDAREWIHRQRTWPPIPVIVDICQHPCYLVHKPSAPGPEHIDEQCLSFVYGEQTIVHHRTRGMKLTYFFFKSIFYPMFNFKVDTKEFGSYLAKTTMLWACEEQPPGIWTEAKLEHNLRYLFSKLLDYLDARMLPHYFMPELNILRNHPEELYDLMESRVDRLGLTTHPLRLLPQNVHTVMQEMLHALSFVSILSQYVSAIKSALGCPRDESHVVFYRVYHYGPVISEIDDVSRKYVASVLILHELHDTNAGTDAKLILSKLLTDHQYAKLFFTALANLPTSIAFYTKCLSFK